MGRSSSNNSKQEALRKMSKLVSSMMTKSDTAPFREPVNWRELELWDYPKIIKRPMDLGTVKRKLESTQYETANECAEDIRLIWSNCMTYNQEGSDFYLLAQALSRKFEDRFRKVRAEYDVGGDAYDNTKSKSDGKGGSAENGSGSAAGGKMGDHKPPTLEEKTQFAGNIFKIGGDALGYVMQVIDLRCPQAIERGNNGAAEDELEINVDTLDPRTFAELDRFIQDKLLVNSHSGRSKSSKSKGADGNNGGSASGSAAFGKRKR
uniref:Bromo domain-containing protein n=1 Tax=Leptocylindrus danicus TaxID=163516 RepID=A0A7S2PE54_9STRA|mmetsp:Transcript_29522/g.43333  ORF Transcript_29522/g.43333 Transcript_29522/m.43333 type:complete len:264 (+) Transcript_29522:268-1059(+)